MTRWLLTTVLLTALPLLGGCLQRTDADLPTQGSGAEFSTDWQLVGAFGESAPELPEGADAWETFYAPGQFREIAGLCATDDEVWVCDLGVSRVQVFDFDGSYLREVGRGNALDGLLPTDEQLYRQKVYGTKNTEKWEKAYGAPWAGSEGELFKAADIVVTTAGYWLADQARTDIGTRVLRGAGFYFVTPEGIPAHYKNSQMYWPEFLAVNGPVLAYIDSTCNYLWMCAPGTSAWRTKTFSQTPNFNAIVGVQAEFAGTPQYQLRMDLASNASTAPGQFNHAGGLAFAYNKLVVCDGGNRRLQVFEGRSDPDANWGTLLRIIPAENPAKGQRFDVPIDLDISFAGLVFVLDGSRREVALLNPLFERIGSFGQGELSDPRAIDLSDDGRHCFITDSAKNQVLHYAAVD